jgi:D-glycero-D-manno-heptose 1,7-bisphosphate phosphatase
VKPTTFSATENPLRTVFLDRDGVLNRKLPEGCYVTRWEQFELLGGVAEAIARLNRAGLLVVVVSNQRGVARGRCTLADIDAIHAALQDLLASSGAHIDGFFVCPHEKGQCDCRKPLPGLFHQARARFPQIEAATSAMIGDSLSDIEFGRNLGMRTICVCGRTEHPSPGVEEAAELADLSVASLTEAVDALLRTRAGGC